MPVRLDGYTFERSKRAHKKYAVTLASGRTVHFGDTRYQQYKDRIGLFSDADHGDKERRRRYYARHGREAARESPKWFSHRYLW